MSDQLLALSFLQPWLWSILERHKGFTVDDVFYAVENRSRPPPKKMVGQRFALHASAGWDEDGEEFIDERLILDLPPTGIGYVEAPPKTKCVRGAIVGTAQLAGAVRLVVKAGTRERLLQVPPIGAVTGAMFDATCASPWAFGEWVLLLTDIRKLYEPVPAKGMLGFWRVPNDVAELVRAREVSRAA